MTFDTMFSGRMKYRRARGFTAPFHIIHGMKIFFSKNTKLWLQESLRYGPAMLYDNVSLVQF